ncbi:hypothetical protein ACFXGA_10020 [Actinosynnema sp. NPDC059335]|uniref:hypothetical protein n=1 Tax=Actinosynnema sp. NPDC059335 TaxID=3346804 RepID=UPI003671953F
MPRSRFLTADADLVFDVLTDLGDLAWLPAGVEVDVPSPNLLRLWLRRGAHDDEVHRPIDIDWENLRITWGGETTPSWSGWVRVERLPTGGCLVSARVMGSEGRPAQQVTAWTDEALERLDTAVRREGTVLPGRMRRALTVPRCDE